MTVVGSACDFTLYTDTLFGRERPRDPSIYYPCSRYTAVALQAPARSAYQSFACFCLSALCKPCAPCTCCFHLGYCETIRVVLLRFVLMRFSNLYESVIETYTYKQYWQRRICACSGSNLYEVQVDCVFGKNDPEETHLSSLHFQLPDPRLFDRQIGKQSFKTGHIRLSQKPCHCVSVFHMQEDSLNSRQICSSYIHLQVAVNRPYKVAIGPCLSCRSKPNKIHNIHASPDCAAVYE